MKEYWLFHVVRPVRCMHKKTLRKEAAADAGQHVFVACHDRAECQRVYMSGNSAAAYLRMFIVNSACRRRLESHTSWRTLRWLPSHIREPPTLTLVSVAGTSRRQF